MKKLFLLIPFLFASVFACTENVTLKRDVISFEVSFVTPPTCGLEAADACAFSLAENAFTARVRIRALNENMEVAASFYNSIVVTTVPSGMFVSGDDVHLLPDNRKVLVLAMNAGVWEGDITFRGSFGALRLMVEDMGYEPAANAANAACAAIYPAQGCYAPDDDNPLPGTGAVGVSELLHFDNPHLADIQRPWDESLVTSGSTDKEASPLSGFRVTIDGDPYLGTAACAPGESRLVVTAISVAGFNISDVCDPAFPDYAHLYVYNFSTPEETSRGDCILSIQGAIDEFQGYTEMKNPLWEVDRCETGDAFCTVGEPKCTAFLPDPVEITATTLGNQLAMEKLESALVEVRNVTSSTEFLRCDANGDGVIDYAIPEEKNCKYDCGDEIGCVVKEDYDIYFTWTVDVGGVEVGVVSQGIVPFDPEAEGNLGLPIYRVRGMLKQLDFGAPEWIILPRDARDVCLTQADCE
jgi:hypothetical protein